MPTLSHLISGKVYSPRGLSIGATITLTKNSESISATSDSIGSYILNVGNLPSGWSSGNSVLLRAYKEGDGVSEVSLVLDSNPNQTQDFYLSQESDIEYYSNEDDLNRYLLRITQLRDFEGNFINIENPIPVFNYLRSFTTMISYDVNDQQEYIGVAPPGTPTSASRWRIQKIIYSGSLQTQIIWANGSDKFDKIWNSRTSYDYS